MPDRVIKRVDTIGLREQQGCNFWFLNHRKEPYEWTDEVPEDDPDFQGLLEEPAPYPDLSAELPGVLLDDKDINLQVVTDDPEPDFAELAAAALDNAGINTQDRLQAAQLRPEPTAGPALIEAANDKIVYEITFNLPNAGLSGANVVPADHCAPPGGLAMDANVHNLATETVGFLSYTIAQESTLILSTDHLPPTWGGASAQECCQC